MIIRDKLIERKYAVFIASCIESIGGKTRIAETQKGYYPEILVGNESEILGINYLFKQTLYTKETDNQALNYHLDSLKNVWLNFAPSIQFPGAPYPVHDLKRIIEL